MCPQPIDEIQGTPDASRPAAADAPFEGMLHEVARAPNVTPLAAEPTSGPFIGRFEKIRVLGSGGFGIVYQARDTELGRHVAIKLLRPDKLVAKGDKNRAWLLDAFHREAEAAAKLNHPNIVTIHDFGVDDGVPFLVLELLVGQTLSARLRGPLPVKDAVSILGQICRGLAHAHAAGVIHRDLKPGNVFLREDGHVKILDFGIAKLFDGGALTETDESAGTPGYMAPEQWRHRSDERTDVFACGVILFQMLAGRLPFDGSERDSSDWPEHQTGLGAELQGIPADLVAIAQRSLARYPWDRFASVSELSDALETWAQREERGPPMAQPYRYLEQFTEDDAPRFFGRDQEIARVQQMLAARSLVALVGPSGAGKTSLVHAGLVPHLRRERIVVAMRPGSDPMRRLYERLAETCGDEHVSRLLPDADALVAAPGRAGRLLREHARAASTPIVLICDQLEEVVTQVQAPAVRRAFAAALVSIGDDPAAPLRVLLTVRGDFLGRLTQIPELRDALATSMVLVGPPDAEALTETLVKPAARVGFEFEAGLAEEMVAAVADEAAPLPILQLAASRLWERRDTTRRLLSRVALASAGGVAGILAAHANEVLDGLPGAPEIALARRLLCELVTDEGTRQRMRHDELLARFEDPQVAGRVLEHLVAGRLVTSSRADRADWVELAHESLIDGWTLLRGWLDEDRVDREYRRRLLAAAAHWQERREPRDLLWRGEALEEALRWRRRYAGFLSAAEQAFLARAEARALRARRVRRRLVVGAATLAGLVTVGSLLTVRAYQAEARAARVREIVRNAGAADDPLVGALILAEYENQPEPPGGATAAAQVASRPIPRVVYRGHDASVRAGAFSRDGKWVATGAFDGSVHVWRSDGTGSAIVLEGHRGAINSVDFSPDGARVLSASDDGTARVFRADGSGEPIVLPHARYAKFTPDGAQVIAFPDTPDGDVVLRIFRADGAGEPVVLRHEGSFLEEGWDVSPDGALVVAGAGDGVGLWRMDGTLIGFRGGTWGDAHFSSDGSHILITSDKCRVWRSDLTEPVDLSEGDRVGAFQSCAFTPDGRRVVYGNGRGITVAMADRSSPPVVLIGSWSADIPVGFSGDGSRVVTRDWDGGALRVWAIEGRSLPLSFGRGVSRALTDRDGVRILTLSYDRTARVWDLGDPPGVRFFRGHTAGIRSIDVSPDGKHLVTGSRDGTLRVWPIAGGTPLVLGKASAGPFTSVAFSPDGTRVATSAPVSHDDATIGGSALVWPLAGGEPMVVPLPAGHQSYRVAFSPDGAWLASGALNRLEVVVTRSDGSGERVTLSGAGWWPNFSPDGSRLIAGGNDGGAGPKTIWRTGDWKEEPVVLPGSDSLGTAVFDPQSSMILAAGGYGLRLFSLDGRELVGLRRPGGEFIVAWSPDGQRIATGLGDGSVQISRTDLAGDTLVLRGHNGPVVGVVFTPDGRQLATASSDATARLWLTDWRDLVHALRAATTACLTVDQRLTYLHESRDDALSTWKACEKRFGRQR